MNTTPKDNTGKQYLDSANLLVFLLRWWKPIVIFCVLAAILGAIASFMIDEKFKSSGAVYATEQNSFGDQVFELVKKNDFLTYGEKEDAERLLQLFNSNIVKNKVINKFDLWKSYKIDPNYPGANSIINLQYNENVEVKMTKFGSINIAVLDKDKNQAKKMVDYIIQVTDSLANTLRKNRAQMALDFAESSYEELNSKTHFLEDSIQKLRSLGVYDYASQIDGINRKWASAILKGNTHQAQILKNEMDQISQYGAAYENVERLLQGSNNQVEILNRRMNSMRMDVHAYIPAMYIASYPEVADKKAYPIRWLIVVMSVIGAFVFTVVILLLVESLRKIKAEEKQ